MCLRCPCPFCICGSLEATGSHINTDLWIAKWFSGHGMGCCGHCNPGILKAVDALVNHSWLAPVPPHVLIFLLLRCSNAGGLLSLHVVNAKQLEAPEKMIYEEHMMMISAFMSVDQIPWSIPLTFPRHPVVSSNSSALEFMCQSASVICRHRQIETVIIQREADCHTDDDL